MSARDVLGVADALESRPWHDASIPNLDQLLWAFRDAPELRSFVDAHLVKLLSYDESRGKSFVHTLDVFCHHGGRKAETARALNLERQTLYYRLGRIEEILGVDLGDVDVLLRLHLSLRARRLLDPAGGRKSE